MVYMNNYYHCSFIFRNLVLRHSPTSRCKRLASLVVRLVSPSSFLRILKTWTLVQKACLLWYLVVPPLLLHIFHPPPPPRPFPTRAVFQRGRHHKPLRRRCRQLITTSSSPARVIPPTSMTKRSDLAPRITTMTGRRPHRPLNNHQPIIADYRLGQSSVF